MSEYKAEIYLKKIWENPHLIGHLVGRDKLIDIHSEWIKYVWNADSERSLQAHRGSYKSTAILEVGCIWWMLFHPNDRIAIIRKSFTDAAAILFTVRQMMKTNEIRYLFHLAHQMYPEAAVHRDGKLVYNFKGTKTPEGNIDAYGIDTGITGKHYDKIICDDIITIKDRISRAERERTKLNVGELKNIIDPGKYAAFIGTVWHKEDAWKILPKPKVYTINDLNIWTEEQKREKKKEVTPSMWSINYLLKHTSAENALFSEIKYSKWKWKYDKVVGQIDSAYKGTHYTAITFMGKDNSEDKIDAIGWVFKENIKDKLDWIITKYQKYRVGTVYIEDNADKGFVADELRKREMLVEDYHENMNKHLKIESHLYKQWHNIYYDEDTDDEYLSQICDYEEGAEPDDAPDSAASLCRAAFNLGYYNDALWGA